MDTARWRRVEAVASRRLEGLRVVLEDLCDPGNRAAIVRSVEAFGLLHLHEVRRDVTCGRRRAQESSARGRRRSAEAEGVEKDLKGL